MSLSVVLDNIILKEIGIIYGIKTELLTSILSLDQDKDELIYCYKVPEIYKDKVKGNRVNERRFLEDAINSQIKRQNYYQGEKGIYEFPGIRVYLLTGENCDINVTLEFFLTPHR